MTTRYAYYPGCTLKTGAKEYDLSTRQVFKALGLELKEIDDWACCGASSAHGTDHLLAIALPARELAKAERMGMPAVAPCAACFCRMKSTLHALRDPATRDAVSVIIGGPAPDKAQALHPIQVLDGMADVKYPRPLSGLKVACYYGCMLVRPAEVMQFDDIENPMMMDRVLRRAGMETVDWQFKTECCGAGHALPHPDVTWKLSQRILEQAKQAGADCVAVACPLCQSNLDFQDVSRRKHGSDLVMPVVYFTQLLGLALGVPEADLGFNRLFTDPRPMLRQKGQPAGVK
jgi:heterodisulfide reductase subunit B